MSPSKTFFKKRAPLLGCRTEKHIRQRRFSRSRPPFSTKTENINFVKMLSKKRFSQIGHQTRRHPSLRHVSQKARHSSRPPHEYAFSFGDCFLSSTNRTKNAAELYKASDRQQGKTELEGWVGREGRVSSLRSQQVPFRHFVSLEWWCDAIVDIVRKKN